MSKPYQLIIQTERGYFPSPFNSLDELCDFHLSKEDSSHYELIQGEQCLYFDFDGPITTVTNEKTSATSRGMVVTRGKESISSDAGVIAIIDRIYSYLSYFYLPFGYAILVYSSSDTVKQSYHVVVRGIHFLNHIACGEMAKQIATGIPSFDSSIYTIKRNFRMMGSRKRDGTRIKRFHYIFNHGYYCNNERNFHNVKESMITFIDKRRSICIGGSNNVVPVERGNNFQDIFNASANTVSIGIAMIHQMFPRVFEMERKDTKIHLRRLKPFHCPLCERVHHSDGGELVIRGDKCFFFCWRNEDRKLFPLIEHNDDEETLAIDVVDNESEVDEREQFVQTLVQRIKATCKFV